MDEFLRVGGDEVVYLAGSSTLIFQETGNLESIREYLWEKGIILMRTKEMGTID